jgi:hypothetical protein
MGRRAFRFAAVILLGVTAAFAWHYGKLFTKDLKREQMAWATAEVPVEDLARLDGQNEAKARSLPIRIVNTTDWHLTMITLRLETMDRSPRLSIQINQSFRDQPLAPGNIDASDVTLAAAWDGRRVRYHVASAEGFQ